MKLPIGITNINTALVNGENVTVRYNKTSDTAATVEIVKDDGTVIWSASIDLADTTKAPADLVAEVVTQANTFLASTFPSWEEEVEGLLQKLVFVVSALGVVIQ
jgi:hypothetical protein